MLAIAYARWSSLEQGKGSTLERQLQVVERYCSQHKLDILERVTDEGSSAYAGTNVQTGNLGKIISRVEAGKLPRDITIVVEQLVGTILDDVTLPAVSPEDAHIAGKTILRDH